MLEEWLHPGESDYRRFVAAVTGAEAAALESYTLTGQFYPYALPAWGLVGATVLHPDGASAAAVPGLEGRSARIMGLGQRTEIHHPVLPGTNPVLRRVGHLASDEEKHGAAGTFRLLTVERTVFAGDSVVANQSESFALGGEG